MDFVLVFLLIFTFVESESEEILDKTNDLNQISIDQRIDKSKVMNGICYSEWSEWSLCTHHCIDFEHFPTRYRIRKVIDNKYGFCNKEELGTIQFEICSDLPPCISGSWINTPLSEVDIIDTYDRIRKQMKSVYPEWVITAIKQYPDIVKNEIELRNINIYNKLDKENENNESKLNNKTNSKEKQEFDIMKSVKKTTINHIKCGCPSRYEPMSFWKFINNEYLMNKLEQICKINIYNQLVFESNGRYVYYCNIGMIIKDVETKKLSCDELDNTEYVACQKNNRKRDVVWKTVVTIVEILIQLMSFVIFFL